MKLFKSRKTYYLYNPNTLSYERVYPSAKDRFFGVLRHLSIGIVIGVGIFFIFSRTFDSPVESLLKKENKLLQTQYKVLSLRLNNALEVLDDIQQRDENLYRAIFQAESIPESVRKSGFGGTNRYEHLMNLSNPELVVSTTRKMDMLSKQLYVQSNSLEELITLGKNQEERSKCIPAIQPIANNDLKRTASGYGAYRPDLPYSPLPLRHGLFRQSGHGSLCNRRRSRYLCRLETGIRKLPDDQSRARIPNALRPPEQVPGACRTESKARRSNRRSGKYREIHRPAPSLRGDRPRQIRQPVQVLLHGPDSGRIRPYDTDCRKSRPGNGLNIV